MNLRELISSTPYTTVHAPHRGHVAYSTRRRAGATVERTARIDLCAHPSFTRLHTLARLATIPLPIYNREGARTVKKDDYALHYDDGHVLAVTIASRRKLVCCSLRGLVAKTSSKSYATGEWLLGSRFTGVCVARRCVGPACVPSARV